MACSFYPPEQNVNNPTNEDRIELHVLNEIGYVAFEGYLIKAMTPTTAKTNGDHESFPVESSNSIANENLFVDCISTESEFLR
jgi:hypothetical protein